MPIVLAAAAFISEFQSRRKFLRRVMATILHSQHTGHDSLSSHSLSNEVTVSDEKRRSSFSAAALFPLVKSLPELRCFMIYQGPDSRSFINVRVRFSGDLECQW